MIRSIPITKHLLVLLVLWGSMLGLTLVGTMPPVAAQQEIQITLLGTYTPPASIQNIVVVGDRTYLTYFTRQNNEVLSGLQILDVRDPASPVLLGDYSLAPRLPFRLVVTETAAIISFSLSDADRLPDQSRNGLIFLDIQDATAPQLVSIYPTTALVTPALAGNRLYLGLNVSRPNQPRRGQLQILDVRNPAAPALLGRYAVPDDVMRGVAAQGDLVYLGGYDTGFTVLDASDPGNPTPIGRWTTPGTPSVRPVIEGDVLYFADRALFTIDISDPTSPQTLDVGGAAGSRVRVQDGIAYLVGNTTSSLNIVDARNPRNLVRLAQYGEDVGAAVPVGDLVYVLANDQLQIVRVTGIPAPLPSPTARCFDETGYCIDGRIRDYWAQNGGLPIFGFPISPQRTFTSEGQPIEAQWFERNRLELHPENAPPYDVLLGRLGVDLLAQQGRDWQAFPRDEAAQPGCRYFAETQQNVCGDILATWQANGLELGDSGISERESLALFGLPISPLQEEDIAGQTYQVQWFERARFERHPENAPPFDVLLGLLGREANP